MDNFSGFLGRRKQRYPRRGKDERTEERSGTMKILEERGKKYGLYENVSSTAQRLKDILRGSPSWTAMEPQMKESIDMICNKLARIANGNPFYKDSWVDVAGYATLVSDSLGEGEEGWSGMTYEERKDCYNQFEVSIEAMDYIEEKLKEKNQ